MTESALERQVRAANPKASTWLAANAGSGKTRVLTDRVARLLLDEAKPEHILCLTYTKAAASEMQNRLFKRLGAWTMMDDDKLRGELCDLGIESRIDTNTLARARVLFAQAIETPGGLKIQTIHSFCASLLRRFPLEAGVSPQFVEMEDRAAKMLRAEVVDDMARGDHTAAVYDLASYVSDSDLDRVLMQITSHKESLAKPQKSEALKAVFGLDRDANAQTPIDKIFGVLSQTDTRSFLDVLAAASPTYQKIGVELERTLKQGASTEGYQWLKKSFLYSDGRSKVGNWPQANHKGAVEAFEPLRGELDTFLDEVWQVSQIEKAIRSFEMTQALHTFATAFLPMYEARKQQHGWLDFDDLILKAKSLLTNPQVAQWVLFRLDGGIDHILVDEAQDTSPAQWSVIENLAQEFTSGEGARHDEPRTLFVVGDKKQSIYSFQGADPNAFDTMRDMFKERLEQIEIGLNTLSLDYSFRSSEPILTLVDQTFSGDRSAGLEKDVFHIAFKNQMPGRVDLWPAIEPTNTKEDRDWFDPIDRVGQDHHYVQLARGIADEILRMKAHETIPDEVDRVPMKRPITEGDILILVQGRNSGLFSEIIAACKQRGLAVAGADRLKVGAELAVRDITAVLSFLALPEDDLSLAGALKSPIFGWSEQDLYDLAHKRPKGQYLSATLRERASEFPKTREILDDLDRQADFLRPYDLIERLLTRHDARDRLLGRLGTEAEDGINALLAQALAYERSSIPSLTGFLEWMAAGELEIKRQMDNAGDQIRVMTVHGAKGLEAPIVFLPDTAKKKPMPLPKLTTLSDTVVWRGASTDVPQVISDRTERERLKREEERQRLLYVAMTRAEKWLVVCAAGDVGDDGDSWYQDVAYGMSQAGAVDQTFVIGQGLRFANDGWSDLPLNQLVKPSALTSKVPDFATIPTPQHDDPLPTLSPSDLGGAKALFGEAETTDDGMSKERGTAIHLVLEHLPHIKPEDHRIVAQNLLGTDSPFLADAIETSQRLLAKPELSHIFETGTLAEVPITANLDALDGRRIHGTIDRLVVDSETVTAIDFKSNRMVPDVVDKTPEGILRQMGAYLAALRLVYPSKTVSTAVLWTETGVLMPMPDELVLGALDRTIL